MPGYVLVELTEKWDGVYVPDKKYDTKNTGIARVVTPADDYLQDKTVYFEDYKDDSRVEDNDTIYAFIKTEDIRGYRE